MFSTTHLAAACAALFAAAPASATVIHALEGGTAVTIPTIVDEDYIGTKGPVTFGPGITYSSTVSSLFGFTGTYGFAPEVLWSGTPLIGLNRTSGTFTLAFAAPLRSFLAEVNWTEYTTSRDASMSAYDSHGNLLDTILLEHNGSVATPGYLGFSDEGGDIARVTFSNEFVAIRDISVLAAAVPEPASWAMLIAGFGLAGLALRGRRVRAAPILG
jgi:hypothetical protein